MIFCYYLQYSKNVIAIFQSRGISNMKNVFILLNDIDTMDSFLFVQTFKTTKIFQTIKTIQTKFKSLNYRIVWIKKKRVFVLKVLKA